MKRFWQRAGMASLATWLTFTGSGRAADLVTFNAAWSYLNPQSVEEDPLISNPDFNDTWFTRTFNTAGWSGPAPGPFAWPSPDIGAHIDAFTEGNASFVRPAQTFLSQPPDGERYSTYFRHNFTIDSPKSNLAFEMLVDDGAVIYLNGQQIAFVNCCQTAQPGENPTYTELASATGVETAYSTFSILDGLTLPAGSHTLAVQVVSSAVTSSDMGFSLRMFDGFVRDPLITEGGNWSYFRGTAEPSNGTLAWTTAAFNDNAWEVGPEGFGYEEAGDGGVLTNELVKTVLDDMQGNYTSVYLRKDFSVADPSKYQTLDLDVDYDDGFVAYINGQQVVSTFADPDTDPTTGIPFDTLGNDLNADHESTNGSGAPGTTFQIDLSQYPGLLKAGNGNVLAIQGINRDPSSDFVLAQLQLFGSAIPGNPPGTLGDFNGDGLLTASDIDALSVAVRAGDTASRYDVNSDGSVNGDDRGHWIISLKKTYFGDATLDGQFNTQDFVQVFQRGEFEDATPDNSTWEDGDWTGDGDFTTADFVAAFQDGGFEQGPRAGVAAVPEPATTSILMVLGLLSATRMRRR